MKLIVNVSENWGIGNRGQLLFHISPDLRRFRQLTTGKTVVYGRKTLLTFPGENILPGRQNIILTTSPDFRADGAVIAHSLDELFELLRPVPREDICVIGGENIYRQLLPFCDSAAVTKTPLCPPADRFFPDLDALPHWHLSAAEPIESWQDIPYQFLDYQNENPLPW